MANLALKYRPQTFEDVTEQSIVVDMLKNICKSDELENRNFLLIGPAGTGKAQPMYSKILTPHGFINMGDVHIGQEVFTDRGNIGKVIGIYPQGVRHIYEIKLADGGAIRVSDEHLNLINIYMTNVVSTAGHTIINDVVLQTTDLIRMMYACPSWIFSVNSLNATIVDDKLQVQQRCVEDRWIASINYIGDEECQCIMIDHPDHTYISDDFIPTHNTTSARIMANMLNNNVGEPIEVDAASHSGVDSIREIIQQAKAYPVGCKYKVFIIDEVHALSQTAFQALLKAFEDGVGRSVFVLCTTNPEKIPATIISRVQVFQLSKISLDGIISRLKYVLDSEIKEGRHITYTDDAVSFIAKLANGGMRDSLTLLDKALTYSADLTTENLVCALNLPNYDDYFKLLGACAKKDNTAITAIINSVYNSGVNFVKWFEGFHGFVMNVVKYIFLQDMNETTIPAHYKDKISKYTTAHAAVCLKLANKLLQLNYELKSTQYLQEVALTHLCTVPKKEGH